MEGMSIITLRKHVSAQPANALLTLAYRVASAASRTHAAKRAQHAALRSLIASVLRASARHHASQEANVMSKTTAARLVMLAVQRRLTANVRLANAPLTLAYQEASAASITHAVRRAQHAAPSRLTANAHHASVLRRLVSAV